MSHISVVFGAIYFDCYEEEKEFNKNVLEQLTKPSEIGRFATLNNSVFTLTEGSVEAVWLTNIIHFGFSCKAFHIMDFEEFICEIDFLLNNLSWHSVKAFADTDSGKYLYEWNNLDGNYFLNTSKGNISPVVKWKCQVRRFDSSPSSADEVIEIREKVSEYKTIKYDNPNFTIY